MPPLIYLRIVHATSSAIKAMHIHGAEKVTSLSSLATIVLMESCCLLFAVGAESWPWTFLALALRALCLKDQADMLIMLSFLRHRFAFTSPPSRIDHNTTISALFLSSRASLFAPA
jgi:hypothetical protein